MLGYIEGFFIVLAVMIVMVVTHELGHFTAAKRLGIKATEFFVGFGKRIWSTKKGETEYGIKWILIGGYVKILGMNPDEEISEEDFPRSYRGSPIWKRAVVIFAGSFVHLMLAVLIMFMTFWIMGVPVYDANNTLSSVGDGTPAAEAGLGAGDTVTAVNGQAVENWEELRGYIVDHPAETVQLTVERDGSEVVLQTTLATNSEGQGYLGVSPDSVQVGTEDYGFFESMKETGIWFGKAVHGAAYSFYKIFTPSVWKQLLGISEPTIERPVTVLGASRIAGDYADLGTFYFLNFIAFILLFLALVNLLPLPPLDGGYLLVLLIEKVRGKEVDLRKLYPISVAVLLFFGTLFLLSLRLDIFNPINLP